MKWTLDSLFEIDRFIEREQQKFLDDCRLYQENPKFSFDCFFSLLVINFVFIFGVLFWEKY